MRTVALLALAGLVGACGGKLAGVGQDDGTGTTTPPVVDAGRGDVASAGMDAAGADSSDNPDVALVDANPDIECLPTTASANGCPAHSYCLLYVATDAAAAQSPVFSTAFPNADIVSSQCETQQTQSVATVCDGGPPFALGYEIYGNQVGWVVCQAP